ncbi:AfsR/SARP family transcriptional regulator [Kaarinaea lacus]
MTTSLYTNSPTSKLQPLDIDFLTATTTQKKTASANHNVNRVVNDAVTIDAALTTHPIVITTLGHFAIHKQGRLISGHEKNQHKPTELLKLVIALGSRSVGEVRISDALWPDADGDIAHTSFSVTLHRIRKLLTMETMLLSDGHLTLNSQVCWVDVWALDEILGQIKSALNDSHMDPDRVTMLTNHALRLYQDHFLGNEDEQPWFIAFREKVKSRFIRRLAQVCDVLEQYGYCHLAIDYYRKGIELDPLSEEFYQRLMKCYAQRGRNIEAVGVYQQCQRLFKALTGFEPSATTNAIYQQIARTTA